MSDGLKPCPFCNGYGVVRKRTWEISYFDDGIAFFVACELCGARGQEKSTRDVAIRAWNRRAYE